MRKSVVVFLFFGGGGARWSACADPESFVIGGLSFFFNCFSLMRGRIQKPPLAGHQRNAI